jgi:hypothetical protein
MEDEKTPAFMTGLFIEALDEAEKAHLQRQALRRYPLERLV